MQLSVWSAARLRLCAVRGTHELYCGANKKKNTESYVLTVFIWWAFGDLNPGPSGYEPDALTN